MIHYMTSRGVTDAWVANELRVVARSGIPFRLHALFRDPETYFSAPDIARMATETNYLYPLLPGAAIVDILAAPFRFGSRFLTAFWNALTGERETLRIRAVGLWHLAVACHWAATLRGEDVRLIHSQWIHSGGTVAMYGAWLLGVPFSFTGHAADLFRNRAALRDKIRRAEFIVCISEFHRQFFLENGARPEQLFIAYCGLDTSHFSPRRRNHTEGEPFHILSSGRLVEKKGFDVLIRACGILRERGFPFRCTIAGSGPLEAELRKQVKASGMEDLITITGQALKQEDIPAFMEQGDIYCLHCVWAKDNDVDGLPQMLMEAMACGLPSVSTELVGIPDLCIHEKTGLLTKPGDAEGLADALIRLAHDKDLADRVAVAGRQHVLDTFDLGTCLEPLLNQYRKRLEPRA
jgi:colanic acid/amylovoran biosynthesis glycosyltransferase